MVLLKVCFFLNIYFKKISRQPNSCRSLIIHQLEKPCLWDLRPGRLKQAWLAIETLKLTRLVSNPEFLHMASQEKAKNKGEDQTVRMRILPCAFGVRG